MKYLECETTKVLNTDVAILSPFLQEATKQPPKSLCRLIRSYAQRFRRFFSHRDKNFHAIQARSALAPQFHFHGYIRAVSVA